MKKNFTGGLSSLLGENPLQPELKPEVNSTQSGLGKPDKPAIKTTQQGTKVGEARATFIVNEAIQEKIKAIAYWERLQIKEVIDEALSSYVLSYERKNGAVKPIPKRV